MDYARRLFLEINCGQAILKSQTCLKVQKILNPGFVSQQAPFSPSA
jgi:hypothetical protein